MKMSLQKDFEEIVKYAHFWNWCPDWNVLIDIYEKFDNSYSVLTPFAYAYLEELIRSTTSEYGKEIFDKEGKPKYRKVGLKLVELAIKENNENTTYLNLLKIARKYFEPSNPIQRGENRNNVGHGYMHPRFWDKETFEKLIHFIAKISKFSKF